MAVIGGGLAGLAAALDCLDAGADVTLLEARPTLGGAVQTLPERDWRPAATARQRPARRPRLLHRVSPLPRADRADELDQAPAARAAGDRRERASRRARPGSAHAASVPAPATRRAPPPCRDSDPAGASRSGLTRRRDVRPPAPAAGLERARDRPLLGRLHPSGAQPAGRRGKRLARALHRADGSPRRSCRERPRAPEWLRWARCTETRRAGRSRRRARR